MIKLTVVFIGAYHCCQLHTKLYPAFFLYRLIPYADEIIGDYQCGFRCNRSTTDQIFYIYIHQILEKKRQYNGTVHWLCIDFKKAYSSVKREVLYSILTDVRFQVLTAASMMFRTVFWDVLPCKIIVDQHIRGAYCLHHQGCVNPWWWRQYAPLKHRSTIILHGSTSQKTILNFILTAMRTWNLTQWHGCWHIIQENCSAQHFLLNVYRF
jgi:hypothetical protein